MNLIDQLTSKSALNSEATTESNISSTTFSAGSL